MKSVHKKTIRVLLTGGGTGGHVMPLVAVSRKIKELLNRENKSAEFLHIGFEKLDKSIMNSEGIQSKRILTGKLRRYFSILNAVDFFKFPIGVIQSFFIVNKFKPDVIFSKGGFVAVPVVYGSLCLKIPILTHESDSTPGLANKLIAKHADKIALGFKEAAKFFPQEKAVFTGNPIKKLHGNKEKGLKRFNISEKKPIILILGGSSGARTINNVVVKALPMLLEHFSIIHQTGNEKFKSVNAETKKFQNQNYRCYPFFKEEYADAIAAADIVVSRAGASAIFETAYLNRPMFLIPLPLKASRGDQIENAKIFEKAGAAKVIQNDDLTPELLVSRLKEMISDKSQLSDMVQQAQKKVGADADLRIAEEIIRLAKNK